MRRVGTLLAVAWLAACAPLPARNPLATWAPSPNHDERRATLIVLHYTDEGSAAEALHTLRTANSGGPVSAHYLIGADGHIYQLVADAQRAWHAGPGRWGTLADVNSGSIGIELDNNGRAPFAPAQIGSLLRLLTDLTTRLHIPPSQVIGHEDMAPERKVDPGPLFPWQQLADAGFGRWPSTPMLDPPPGFDPWLALQALGYAVEPDPAQRAAVLRAFHHHFRGMEGGAQLDAQDLRVLYTLTRQPLTTEGQ